VCRNLFWLSDEQWKRIEPHLPTDVRGVERVDDRRVISGIVHVLKSGCRWCDCPPDYGPPTTIYNRFVRWARRGVWEDLFRELAGNGRSADTQMIDSTHVKAHRSAAFSISAACGLMNLVWLLDHEQQRNFRLDDFRAVALRKKRGYYLPNRNAARGDILHNEKCRWL
jgi:transposase